MFTVLFEDDWELLGTGDGDVASYQHAPGVWLADRAAETGVPVTFMVDALQPVAFERTADPERIGELDLWRAAIDHMLQRGCDVQLHLHPQWWTAQYRGGRFQVDPRWNIGAYPPATIREMVDSGVAALKRALPPGHAIVAYKAGHWGMQPWAPVRDALRAHGVRLFLGVRKGHFDAEHGVDYRHLDEADLPFVPDASDVTRVSATASDEVVVPLSWDRLSLFDWARWWAHRTRIRRSGTTHVVTADMVVRQSRWARLRGVSRLSVTDQPFSVLRASTERVIDRLRDRDAPLLPIVIESHTKGFRGNEADIARYLEWLARTLRGQATFVTATGLLTQLNALPRAVVGTFTASDSGQPR